MQPWVELVFIAFIKYFVQPIKVVFIFNYEFMSNISKKYEDIMNRPIAGIVHFSDVFSEKPVDIDAELTAITRNLGNLSDITFPIGKNLKLADYGVNLLNDLIEEQRRIIKHIKQETGKIVENNFSSKGIVAIANSAPRNSKSTKNGKNAEDFYLAITNNDLEIFTTPLSNLQALETRNKIVALYRIPNEKLATTDGNHEQFRSSIIVTMRYFSHLFEIIFQYKNVEELKKAKKNNTHPKIIPVQENLAEFAFADKFGNVRISVKNNKEFKKKFKNAKFGDLLNLKIGNSNNMQIVYTKSLKTLNSNEFGIYQNVADKKTQGACYWEIVKKSEDCNNDAESAVAILKSLNSNFENEEIFIEE